MNNEKYDKMMSLIAEDDPDFFLLCIAGYKANQIISTKEFRSFMKYLLRWLMSIKKFLEEIEQLIKILHLMFDQKVEDSSL
jgi:hypothetical protein